MFTRFKEAAFKDRKSFVKFLILVCFCLIGVGVTIWCLPTILSLKDEAGREALRAYIQDKGAWGFLILSGIQMLQIVIAFIPGEPVEVVAGVLFGTFGGWAACTLGSIAGTVFVYYMVKLLGISFVGELVDLKKMERFRFLRETRRLEAVTFLLFFIPGTPKDLLTYFMPFTKIKPLSFFSIVAVARIPSIVTSTFAGASISEGKWLQTILIFAGTAGIALLGIWLNRRLEKHLQKKRRNNKGKTE